MTSSVQQIGIVGAGTFGLALTKAISRRGHHVHLVTRRPQNVPKDAPTKSVGSDPSVLKNCELVFVSVPSAHISEQCRELGQVLDGGHLVVHVSRGLVGEDLRPVSRIVRDLTAVRRIGCLAGPINSELLAQDLPGGGVIGTHFPEITESVRDALGSKVFRIYSTDDLLGVEFCSALSGLLALALGYSRELGFGPASVAVLINRSMAEMARLGVALGAAEKTFWGMAGYGDLLAAVGGDERPEVKLGRALARGMTKDEASKHAGTYVEGLTIASRLYRFAQARNISAPIVQTITEVLSNEKDAKEGLARLLGRKAGNES